jgi:hypothetical protein
MRAVRIGLMLAVLSLGTPAVWAQTSTTVPSTTTTTVFLDCFGPGGIIIPCPTTTSSTSTSTTTPATTTTSTHLDCPLPGGGIGPCPTTTTTVSPIPLPGFICSLLATFDSLFAPFRQLLLPLLQRFGCPTS